MGEALGSIGWADLTVEDAAAVRDFYAGVVGWEAAGVDMGGYADFAMGPRGAEPVAGVCFGRGSNAEIREKVGAAWLLYVTVRSVDAALEACDARGGEVLVGPREMPGHRYAVIRDPAGAAMAVIESTGAGSA